MNNISKRLKVVADFVLKGKSKGIIDVGCDHAFLDIYLFLQDSSLKITASDNKKEPLKRAIDNIKSYKLENNIKTLLSDGISLIDDNIDTAVISGMGTENIIKILNNKNIKYLNRLIISSNNKYPLLRKELLKLGFIIKDEKIVFDNKYYIVIEFIRGNKNYNSKELEYGPILLKNKDNIFYNYYKEILDKYELLIRKIPVGIKKNKLIKEITEIKAILNK